MFLKHLPEALPPCIYSAVDPVFHQSFSRGLEPPLPQQLNTTCNKIDLWLPSVSGEEESLQIYKSFCLSFVRLWACELCSHVLSEDTALCVSSHSSVSGDFVQNELCSLI